MVRRIVFTIALLLIACGSFTFGLLSCGSVDNQQTEEAETQAVQTTQTTQTEQRAQIAQENAQNAPRQRGPVASLLIPDLNEEKGVQKTLGDKSRQTLDVWETVKITHGVISILLSSGATGSESLSPLDGILTKLSNMLSRIFSAIIFGKILLTLSSYIVFLAIIPVCALITILLIWTYGDRRRMPRVVIVFVMLSLVISFAFPAAFQLSTLMENKILSGNIETLITSIDEKGRTAESMERSLSARRQGSSVAAFIVNAKNLSNSLTEDVINYSVIFIFIYIFIPFLFLVTLFFLTKYFAKMILTR
ncbi:MAG: LMBR1 domain-containing protein [Treponema sp.]|nr:LMBR1 domain-containing protein [Treponema sp.]